jgi:hypothetical protein
MGFGGENYFDRLIHTGVIKDGPPSVILTQIGLQLSKVIPVIVVGLLEMVGEKCLSKTIQNDHLPQSVSR